MRKKADEMTRFLKAVVLCALMAGWVNAKEEKTHSDPKLLQKVQEVWTQGDPRLSLSLVSAEDVKYGVEVICDLTYLDIQGKPVPGQAKVFLPSEILKGIKTPMPYCHVAGYEVDRGGGEGFLHKGTVASTPHGESINPLIRGENLDVAILHRMRALPFIEDSKVQIVGGSAGGYMTLTLAAETFPLSFCIPDCPPVNLGYNIAYFDHNKALAAEIPQGQDHPNMPVLNAVCSLRDPSVAVYGEDFQNDAWLQASPISRLHEITCPTLILLSTADILVPIDQFCKEWVLPFDPSKFPPGFEMAMDALMNRPEARTTFSETVPPDQIALFKISVPPGTPKFGWDSKAEGDGFKIDMPFSREKIFSVVVADEGAPEPQANHVKFKLDVNKDAFLKYGRELPLHPSLLTAPKLERLMKRALYQDAHPELVKAPDKDTPFLANRMDFQELEKADVLRGLRTFAKDPECAQRLCDLYQALPSSLQALGSDFATAGPEEMVKRLQSLRM